MHKFLRFLLYVILFTFAFYYLFPLYVMISTSLKDIEEIRSGNLFALPKEITFWAWEQAWSKSCSGVSCVGLKPFFFNSMQMTIPAVLLSTLIGSINGYILTKWEFKGSNIIFGLLLFGCFIPLQVVILPMAKVLGLFNIAGSIPGLILVHVIYGIGFTTLFFRNYYVSVPTDLVKAAKIDGAGFWQIFWHIFLPISIPVIMVSIIWQFTNIWNDFLFGVSFSQGQNAPITVSLNNMVNSTTSVKYYNIDMAAAMITAIPTLLVYVISGKYFVRGLTAGSVKG